jgi:anion-transporting  ArsA/GET3 family ATPase
MRAVAQVQGALTIAQHNRRDKIRAVGDMREACSNMFLAERAFFRFNRGGQVSGPSIHLAVELARCWGNIEYGIQELSRAANQSEMQAYAWDLETNTKPSISFIVPHKRDKRDGPVDLESMRDIYENNANLGARRVREMIFRVLPASFIEEAKVLCERTLAEGGGDDIQTRRESLLEAFSELGVTRKMVEKKLGRSADSLTPYDLGTARVIYNSIKRGEATIKAEFGEQNEVADRLDGLVTEEEPGDDFKLEQ